MTSRQHQDWINHGKPDSGLALPLQLLANTLAAAGYTVYVYPNDAHLDAEPPEDHTYYSETGWPTFSPKWWRHAIDIMPPPSGKNLPSLTKLGQTLFDKRQSGGITWLKYMNWPSDGNLSHAVQDRWEPNHSRGSSNDTGHIHLSSITGVETLDSSFNPLTNIVVAGTQPTPLPLPALPSEDSMFHAVGPNGHYLCTGFESVQVDPSTLADLKTLIDEGLVPPLANRKDGHNTFDFPRDGWTPAFGPLRPQPGAGVTDAQVAAMATAVAQAVIAAAPTHQALTSADAPVIEAAVNAALKEGIK